ncbi:hypothetical protein ABZ721_38535 [Streptomyces sp. NPDC006733]|uniref:hypothetical protein n=1 Tax=Streptomyces sp. NPDC006733 TaxID=3155460 RepID=UPI00340C34E5
MVQEATVCRTADEQPASPQDQLAASAGCGPDPYTGPAGRATILDRAHPDGTPRPRTAVVGVLDVPPRSTPAPPAQENR